MSLPESIQIQPLARSISARITVPGSKSVTNRALLLAVQSAGETTLRGALWSEDTQVLVDCLRTLGFEISVQSDSEEPSNRVITVRGRGPVPFYGGTPQAPVELFVGNAGTAARFLSAFVCLGEGTFQLRGVARMHERPQAALFQALRQLGYRIDSPNNRLPAVIQGGGPRPGVCHVSIEDSSQFASALLLAAERGGWKIQVVGENAEESPYIEMTRQLLSEFPRQGGTFNVEADASSGSYFLAANCFAGLLQQATRNPVLSADSTSQVFAPKSAVIVANWPKTAWQVDARFARYLPLPKEVSRERDLGDSIMTAIVLAPFAEYPVRFTHLGRLRLQECERVAALRVELTRCGASVSETGDTLTVHPASLHGAEVETYHDHRMAMCFAILGLKVPGIKIKNPACVKKTFPNFFQKLAAPVPGGLGVAISESATGRLLAEEELFAS